MSQELTDDILVTAFPKFEGKQSNPTNGQFIFSYQIEIHNTGNSVVQLLSRHWYIFDSNAEYSEVKGEGVIGRQPIIAVGGNYTYESFCQLKTDMGLMWGSYLMKRLDNDKLFEVAIPEFQLIEPSRLN